MLMLELRWMAHYFGRVIFNSMVLVATVPPRFSRMKIDNIKESSLMTTFE